MAVAGALDTAYLEMLTVTGWRKELGGMMIVAPSPRERVASKAGLTTWDIEATAVPAGVGVMDDVKLGVAVTVTGVLVGEPGVLVRVTAAVEVFVSVGVFV